jgi:hypothetical protein
MRGWLAAAPFVFALMLVNKESALTVVPVLFPLLLRRTGFVSALKWTSLFGAMGCAWVWFIRNRYAALPGQPMEWWLPDNLAFWSRPTSYLGFAQLYAPGLLAPKGGNLGILVVLGLSLRFGWRGTPWDVRAATAIMAIVLVPLFLVAGAMDETRALGLLFPFLFLVGEQGARALFTKEEAGSRVFLTKRRRAETFTLPARS